jgi:hypothetical protein
MAENSGSKDQNPFRLLTWREKKFFSTTGRTEWNICFTPPPKWLAEQNISYLLFIGSLGIPGGLRK